MVCRTDRPAMTIAVDLGRKATKQTNKHTRNIKFNIGPQLDPCGTPDLMCDRLVVPVLLSIT